MRDQTAPLTNLPRSESATHMPLTALVALIHDLVATGVKARYTFRPIEAPDRLVPPNLANSTALHAQIE